MNQITTIGIDVGTSGMRLVTVINGQEKKVLVDAILATKLGDDAGNHGNAGRKTHQAANMKPKLIGYKGAQTYVGYGAHLQENPFEPVSQTRFTEGSALIRLILAGLSELGLNDKSKLHLNLSLPVIVCKDSGVEEDIASWLMGSHLFYSDGRRIEYEISSFDFGSQPLHAYIGMTHDLDFNWSHPTYPNGTPFITFDLGLGTIDMTAIDVVDHPEYGLIPTRNENLTRGASLGYLQAAVELRKLMEGNYGFGNYTDYELCLAIMSLTKNGKASLFVDGFSMDVSELAQQAFDNMLNQAVKWCFSQMPASKAGKYAISIIGGPMNDQNVARRFRSEYKTAIINPDRFLAARGAYISAMARGE